MTSIFEKARPLTKISAALISFITIASLVISAAGTAAITQPVTAGPGQRLSSQEVNQYRSRFQQSLATTNANGSNSAVYYYNWSGYAATATSTFNEVQSTFVQPTVSCTTPGAWTLFWVGFDGYNNGTVEQAGTAVQCSTGNRPTPTYYAWWEMYPTNTIQTMPLTIKPGQNIQATVTYTASNNSYSLNVSNLSSRQQYTQNTTCATGLVCARQSAEWIIERPTVNGNYTPLADWGSMNLTGDEASNTTMTTGNRRNPITNPVLQPLSAFANNPINMVNDPDTGEILAAVGSVNRNGTTFVDSWQAAQ